MGKRSRQNEHEQKFQIDENAPDIQENEDPTRRQKKILNHNFKPKYVKPLTKAQEKTFLSYGSGKNLLLHGMAGTGKSYIALYLALSDLFNGLFKRIVIVRSAVTTRDQGFLPGTLAEKMAMYEVPYRDIIGDLLVDGAAKQAYDLLKKRDHLEFMSTSFIRGLTMDDAVIIVDEVQNMTDHEISSVLTRVGKNSRLIICGDFRQNDLSQAGKKAQETGISSLIKCVQNMKSFDLIEFHVQDIVRSGFVKEYLIARLNVGLN